MGGFYNPHWRICCHWFVERRGETNWSVASRTGPGPRHPQAGGPWVSCCWDGATEPPCTAAEGSAGRQGLGPHCLRGRLLPVCIVFPGAWAQEWVHGRAWAPSVFTVTPLFISQPEVLEFPFLAPEPRAGELGVGLGPLSFQGALELQVSLIFFLKIFPWVLCPKGF